MRRAPVSKILVCHPKRPRRFSLSEFLNEKDDNDGLDGQRAYISGHNRWVVVEFPEASSFSISVVLMA